MVKLRYGGDLREHGIIAKDGSEEYRVFPKKGTMVDASEHPRYSAKGIYEDVVRLTGTWNW